ncbi:hypothetical protein Trydic_g15880 [Trypoxylus dichotomus]
MQQFWSSKLSWDESLPQQIHSQWEIFRKHLHNLNNRRIPRYAAIEHIQSKTTNSQSTVSTKLLCSKSKIAPVRVIPIPMLELCAALVLAQLIDKMKTALKCHIQRYYLWSDSSVVLH